MPSINGGMKCIKYLLFLFNLACVAIGAILIYIGVSVKKEFSKYFSTIVDGDDGGHSIPPTIFITVGAIMFIIAFLGCCGAFTENHCMMMLYSVLLGLILVIQLGGAVAAYAFENDVEGAVQGSMEKSMNLYYNESIESHKDMVSSWNFMQHNLKCCGVHNYTDWVNAAGHPTTGFIPNSCCISGIVENCTLEITKDNVQDKTVAEKIIFTEGCLTAAVSSFSINHLGNIGLILAVIEVLGIICACMMARSIRFSYETV